MINVKTKRHIRKPRNIVEILMLAIQENALLDVLIQPARVRTNAFFVCQDGNMGKRESLLITSLNTKEEIEACQDSKVIKIFMQTVRYLIELDGIYEEFVTIKDTPCIKLKFPEVITISPQARQFKRRRVPFSLDLPMFISLKGKKPHRSQVYDIAIAGCSFIRHIDEKSLANPMFPKGTQLQAAIASPDPTNNYEVPVNGVVRKIFTMRNRYNEIMELLGMEFNLISTNAQGDFNKLLRFIDDEFARTKDQTNPIIDRCILADQDSLQGGNADVQQAVDSSDPDRILNMLAIHGKDPGARRALISGIIKIGMTKSGISSQLVTALHSLAEIEWSSDADMLVEAIIERKHVTSALKILPIVPDDSENIDSLVQLITVYGSIDRLLEAIRVCKDKPRIQQNILPLLARKAPVKYMIEAYSHIQKESPLLDGLLEQILDKTKSTVELMPLIRSTEDVTSEMFLKLIRRFVKGAPVKELVKLLEIQVSDRTLVGEFIITEIVARGKPAHMAEAYDFVGMDSFASVALAFGMFRYATLDLIESSLDKSKTLPRAAIILRYASLKKASEEDESQGFSLAKMLKLNKEGDRRQVELNKVEKEAKKLLVETEEKLYKLSEKIHGAASGRLKRN